MVTTSASTIANDSDEEDMTTAEFAVDLTDNQTWAINFYECAAEGDLECLEEILDSNYVGVNDVDVDGFTALMVAAAEGHRNVVRMLLQRGADVGIRTHELRSTALHFSAKHGDAEIMEALCECGPKVVDCWNVNADTPLIWACMEGRAEAVKVLLKYGADVNVLNQYGASTLMCAVMIGEDPEQDEESDKERAKILTMLLEKNDKLVNFQDREGSSAMHLAASCGYLECVKTLLAFGAEITLRNVIGQTPLEEAQDSELRESSLCVEHLRGIWQQLEEEAASRMMAMLEMEEKADKSATGNAGGPIGVVSGKKSKKKNKKAKRKAAAKQHQQVRQEDDLDLTDVNDSLTEQNGSHDRKVVLTRPEPVVEDPAVESNEGSPIASGRGRETKDDNAHCTSSDEDEDALAQNLIVSSGKDSNDDRDGHNLESKASHLIGKADAHCVHETGIEVTPSVGPWTTVGKKHRSAIGAITNTLVKASASHAHEKVPLPTVTRPRSAAAFSKTASHTSRLHFGYRSGSVRERSSTSGHSSSVAPDPSFVRQGGTIADIPARTQVRRRRKTNGLFVESRSIASSPLLDSNALACESPGQTTGSTETSSLSSCAGISASRLSNSSGLPWRGSSLYGSSPAPYTAFSSSMSAGLHYTSAGRLTWKHQRGSGHHHVALETRDRWVRKLRLSNESVAETLSYLACGLCGELVNDNLQCSGDMSRNSDEKIGSACPQLYCASCLESSAFQAANSALFKCVRCHGLISKDSMIRNSFAQAQAASLGLSMPKSTGARTQDDTYRYALENMQRILENSDPRISAVDLHAFHLVPGSDLSTMSNGQLEVLESVHQLALVQTVEQRLANARALERLQIQEWLKMQRDVMQFAPR